MTISNLLGYRPYVSGDIETTGLNTTTADVLELAFVYDNGIPGVNLYTLPFFHCYINHDSFDDAEPYALHMNANYFTEWVKNKNRDSKYLWLTPEQAVNKLNEFLRKSRDSAIAAWDMPQGWEKNLNKIQAAGKNFAGFDRPLLKEFFTRYSETGAEELMKNIDYKVIDLGAKFDELFGYVPGLDAINKMTGRKPVSHSAYEDAIDVIAARRYFWCKTHNLNPELAGLWMN